VADITLNGITVDPLATNAALGAFGPTVLNAAMGTMPVTATKYVLVQVEGPLTSSNRRDLEMAGVARILEFVPVNSYVCRYEPDDLTPV
jgi:serine protease AprX